MPIAETKNQNCQGSRARAKFLSSFTLISGLFVNTLWSIYVPWYVLSWVLDHSLNFSSAMLVPVLIRAPSCMPQAFCRFAMAHTWSILYQQSLKQLWEQRLVDKLTKYTCTFHSNGPSIFCSKNGLSFSYRFQLKF